MGKKIGDGTTIKGSISPSKRYRGTPDRNFRISKLQKRTSFVKEGNSKKRPKNIPNEG